MKKIALLLLICLMNSCNHSKKINAPILLFDTVTPLNHYIKLTKNNKNDTNSKLFYGVDKNDLKAINIDYDLSKEAVSQRIKDYRDFISLRTNCGYNCWSDEFFELNNNAKPFIVYNILQSLSSRNIVVFFNSEENKSLIPTKTKPIDKEPVLIIMNLKTKEKQLINLDTILISQNLLENIVEVKFEDDCLMVKWISQEKGPENSITRIDHIKINVFD